MKVPARSVAAAEAGAVFGWLAPFMAMDMPASSAWTRERRGWRPSGPGLIADLEKIDYPVFGQPPSTCAPARVRARP